MTAAIKAIAGIGGLCALAPTSYAAYSIWNSNNPTGKKWLENSGYSLEPPSLNSINSGGRDYGCADRLFKEMKLSGIQPTSSDETVYGCAIMRLETKTEGNKFSDFKSNIAIRKGNKGWIINVSASSSGIIDQTYIELSYSSNEWTQEAWRLANMSTSSSSTSNKIIIKVPEESDYWFSGDVNQEDHISASDNKTIKEFNKAWISDSNKQDWILKGMMVAKESEDKSQIFCSKGVNEINNCFNGGTTISASKVGQEDMSSFKGAKFATSSSSTTPTDLTSKLKATYQTLSSSKGYWTNLSEICSYGDIRNIDTDKQRKLEMFCAIVPPKINTRPLPSFPPHVQANHNQE